jgi:hypothetical protein
VADGKDYEVGYGKPPRQHRYRKGQSGNPRGRPRRKRNEAALINRIFDELVTVTVDGKRQRVTVLEAALRRAIIATITNGSVRDLGKLLDLHARYGSEPEVLRNARLEEEAQGVTEKALQMFDRMYGTSAKPDSLPEEG